MKRQDARRGTTNCSTMREMTMRILGWILGLLVGFVTWGLTMALSGGVGPVGRANASDTLVFMMPVVVFCMPLAALSVERGFSLAALWLMSLAPLLGALNVGFSMANAKLISVAGRGTLDLPTYWWGWAALTAIVLGTVAYGKRSVEQAQKEDLEATAQR